MKAPALPPDEALRLGALQRYAVLDTLPEKSLDDLTELAAHICGTPIVLISLIDENRQWFKSRIGMAASETPRDISFCGHAILQPDLFIVPDAEVDERFSDNPLVTGEPHIRFYAGAPLSTADGYAIGALCVMDRVPRQLNESQQGALRALSRQVMAQLDLRNQLRQLQESDDRLLKVFQNCPVALSINSMSDRCIVDVNASFVSFLGWPREEAIGHTMQELGVVNEEQTLRIRAELQRTRILRNAEITVTTRSGETRHVLIGTEIVQLGHQPHAITTFVDITARRQAETAVLAAEERYHALFENAPDGIAVADPSMHYIDVNASTCRMLGYTREELIGMHASQVVVSADSKSGTMGSTLQSLAGIQRECQLRRKNGSVFSAEMTEARMPDGNMLGTIHDITERKKLEQQFLRSQRMESIGTLAGGIAHDLNNVLTPILLSLTVLRDLARDDDDLELIGVLETSAQHGADLVQQVLSFARGVEGRRVPVNLLHVFRDLLRVLRDTFPKSINTRFEPPSDLWTVTGDQTQLHQVFMNLCVNARDAMPQGGILEVSMENVRLDATYVAMNFGSSPGAFVAVKIADTGAGISPEIRDRLFEPFFTTKGVGQGTGLGLSTTLAIVKSHNGFINLYSEVGQGTTFTVYLPAEPENEPATDAQGDDGELPRGNGELILVVDDELTVRTIVQSTLERAGYRVLLAANGAEAVAIYAQNRSLIAAVLTDMAMPVMDGAATIIALRSLDPEVKVIGSSGLATESGVSQALSGGLQHFVPKPYTAERLLKTFRQVLRPGNPALPS